MWALRCDRGTMTQDIDWERQRRWGGVALRRPMQTEDRRAFSRTLILGLFQALRDYGPAPKLPSAETSIFRQVRSSTFKHHEHAPSMVQKPVLRVPMQLDAVHPPSNSQHLHRPLVNQAVGTCFLAYSSTTGSLPSSYQLPPITTESVSYLRIKKGARKSQNRWESGNGPIESEGLRLQPCAFCTASPIRLDSESLPSVAPPQCAFDHWLFQQI